MNNKNNHSDGYDDLLVKISQNIKAARIACGLTQEQMMEFGFNYRHYQRIESGKQSFNLYTLYRLSQIFGVSIRSFF